MSKTGTEITCPAYAVETTRGKCVQVTSLVAIPCMMSADVEDMGGGGGGAALFGGRSANLAYKQA